MKLMESSFLPEDKVPSNQPLQPQVLEYKNNDQKRWLFMGPKARIMLGTILLLIAAYTYATYFIYGNPLTKLSDSSPCQNFDSFLRVVQSGWQGDHQIELKEEKPDSSGYPSFNWRRQPNQPVVSYYAKQSTSLIIYSQRTDNSATFFQSNILSKLSENNLQESKINYWFRSDNSSDNTSFGWWTYGFTNGPSLYRIFISDPDVYLNRDGTKPYPDNTTSLNLSCSSQDMQMDKIYDKIISAGNYLTDHVLTLNGIYNCVVSLGVGATDSDTGFAQSWWVDGNNIEKLFEGQDASEDTSGSTVKSRQCHNQ